MDEQVEDNKLSYVPITDAASYERFARKNLLDPLSKYIDSKHVLLKPDLDDIDGFDEMIESHGGIDLLILAIGTGGHYAQVMPGTSISTGFHVAKLMDELKKSHTQKGSKSYEGAKFREYGMSLGPKQVISAKNIIVMISGNSKKGLFRELRSYKIFDPKFPISIILHPDVRTKTRLLVTNEVLN